MGEFFPEGKATKWSLLAAWDDDSGRVEHLYMEDTNKALNVANYVWNTTTLAWEKAIQNLLITDSVYLAVDGVEALLTTIDADTSGMALSLAVIDDWDESDRCKVNLISGQSGISAGAGAVAANTPRMTLASDDPAVVSLAALAGVIGADSNFYVEIAGVETEVLASTTTPLGANSSWTSGELNVYHYSTLNVYAESDKAGTIKIEFSHDGTNWRSHTFVVPAGTGFHTVRPVGFLYSRITYTNGAQAQNSFVCYVSGNPTALSNPMQRFEDEIEGDQLAVMTRGVIAGETTAGGGAYVNVKVNPSGTLEVNANQPDTTWAVQDSTLTASVDGMAAQLDTDFGALLVYAAQHDTDFGTIISHLSAIQTAVQIMDDWDLNDRCRVSPISGQDGVQAGEGAITALTQRVTIATDDDSVAYLAAADTNWDTLLAQMLIFDTNWDTLLTDTANLSTLLAEVQDSKADYFLGGWLVDGVNVYVGKEDKDGNYMIIKHATDTGVVTYEGGSGGLPASAGWAAMAYQAYSTEF